MHSKYDLLDIGHHFQSTEDLGPTWTLRKSDHLANFIKIGRICIR